MAIQSRSMVMKVLSVDRLCRAMRIPRSLYYRTVKLKSEPPIVEEIRVVLAEFPRYGYRRVAVCLGITPKRTRTLMKRYFLAQKPRKRKVHRLPLRYAGGQNLVRGVPVVSPGQVVAFDVTELRLARTNRAYFAAAIDVFTREIIGYALSMRNDTSLTLNALHHARLSGNLKQGWIHHSDRGANYTSHSYLKAVEQHGGHSSFSDPGKPTQNAFIESFFKSFKTEEGGLDTYNDLNDATTAVTDYIETYNNRRLHSSIGMQPPTTYRKEFTLLP
jgi:putative transposase